MEKSAAPQNVTLQEYNNLFGVIYGKDCMDLAAAIRSSDANINEKDSLNKARGYAAKLFAAASRENAERNRPQSDDVKDAIYHFYKPQNTVKVAPVLMAFSFVPFLGGLSGLAAMGIGGSWVYKEVKDEKSSADNKKPDVLSRLSSDLHNLKNQACAVELGAVTQVGSLIVSGVSDIAAAALQIGTFAILAYSWWSNSHMAHDLATKKFEKEQYTYNKDGKKIGLNKNAPENTEVANHVRAQLVKQRQALGARQPQPSPGR
jgi:hypothetical protein